MFRFPKTQLDIEVENVKFKKDQSGQQFRTF